MLKNGANFPFKKMIFVAFELMLLTAYNKILKLSATATLYQLLSLLK